MNETDYKLFQAELLRLEKEFNSKLSYYKDLLDKKQFQITEKTQLLVKGLLYFSDSISHNLFNVYDFHSEELLKEKDIYSRLYKYPYFQEEGIIPVLDFIIFFIMHELLEDRKPGIICFKKNEKSLISSPKICKFTEFDLKTAQLYSPKIINATGIHDEYQHVTEEEMIEILKFYILAEVQYIDTCREIDREEHKPEQYRSYTKPIYSSLNKAIRDWMAETDNLPHELIELIPEDLREII